MILGAVRRSYGNEQRCRAARRRMRETLALRRAAASAEQRTVDLPSEAKRAA